MAILLGLRSFFVPHCFCPVVTLFFPACPRSVSCALWLILLSVQLQRRLVGIFRRGHLVTINHGDVGSKARARAFGLRTYVFQRTLCAAVTRCEGQLCLDGRGAFRDSVSCTGGLESAGLSVLSESAETFAAA